MIDFSEHTKELENSLLLPSLNQNFAKASELAEMIKFALSPYLLDPKF